MNVDRLISNTVNALKAERAKIDQALLVLGGRPTRKRRPMSPAERRAHSRRMKAFWAAKRTKH